MTEPQQTVRDVINKYSPIVKGRSGLSSLAFKAAARSIEFAQDTVQAASDWVYPSGIANAAGQLLVNTSPAIAATFARMEKKLSVSFNKAASNAALDPERGSFLALADEVKQDAKILAPQATILRQEFDIVTEPYKFMLAKDMTLEQGIAQVTQARDHANPVTIRRHTQPVPQPAKAVGL